MSGIRHIPICVLILDKTRQSSCRDGTCDGLVSPHAVVSNEYRCATNFRQLPTIKILDQHLASSAPAFTAAVVCFLATTPSLLHPRNHLLCTWVGRAWRLLLWDLDAACPPFLVTFQRLKVSPQLLRSAWSYTVQVIRSAWSSPKSL